MHVAVTGARFDLRVNGVQMAPDTALRLSPGDELVLGERRCGARAYVAVRGGLDVPVVLGSRSAWPLLPRRGALQDGTRLSIGTRVVGPVGAGRFADASASCACCGCCPGRMPPRAPDVLAALCAGTYRVTPAASRMAYPLEGPAVPLVAPARPSSGTVTGALQILPSGLPVLLMAERQTTGGYPVAAIVITADLTHAAQLAPGDEVRFTPGTRADALRALWTADAPRRQQA